MGPQVFCQREVGRGSGPWDLKCSAREKLGEAVAHGTSSVRPDHTIMYIVEPLYKGHSE